MAESTLTQVFGSGASQTASQLIISKTDLATVGLTASATNSAESLYVAVMLLAMQRLNSTNQNTEPEIQVTTEFSFETLTSRNSSSYRQKSYTTSLETVDVSPTVDPDNY